jgi:hypothetical protein
MFGGWGPHLGHLVRAGSGASSELWFVDDVCSQASGADLCDVNQDKAIGYFKSTPGGWTKVAEAPIPGVVQQNTATIVNADGKTFSTFGLDVQSHAIVECVFTVASATSACSPVAGIGPLPSSSNYIGAAISPQGHRMVWWTRVQDGGGGDFEYIVDYGGGWNGPRIGPIGGYNDASYINVAFGIGANQAKFTMHGQLVSGLAPNWSFFGAVGEGDTATSAPVTWTASLASPMGDAVESTDDILTDPITGDEHLFARTHSGAAVYFHRPAQGAWSGPLFTLPASYRVRFVLASDAIYLVYGIANKGLGLRAAAPAARITGSPIDWAALAETTVALPTGYENIYAIYPEAPAYQRERPTTVNVALVGAVTQNEALSVAILP